METKEILEAVKEMKDTALQQIADLRSELEGMAATIQRPGFNEPVGGDRKDALKPEERKALNEYAAALIAGDQLRANKHLAQYQELKGMQAGSDPDGGYFLPPPHTTGAMTTVMAEISPMDRLAETINMPNSTAYEEVVDKEQATATWVSELQARTDTANPQIGKLRIDLHEIYAQPKVSQTLLDTTAFDVWNWLSLKVAEAFAVTQSAAFHSGNGVGKPRGFLTYSTALTADATRPWGTLEYVVTGQSAAFPTASASVNPADVLINVVSAMKAQYRNGAAWLMNRATAGTVRKLKDADGRHVWVDSLVQGQPSVLLGYPVEISEDMPAIGADSLSIAFANWRKAYKIARLNGVKFLADPFTDKPNVRLYGYSRVGGGCANFEALKLLKFGTS